MLWHTSLYLQKNSDEHEPVESRDMIMSSFCLLFMSVVGVSQTTIPDAPSFIDSLYEKVNDLYFEYEGLVKGYIPEKRNGQDDGWHDLDNFSGSILYRKDGSIKLESIHLETYPNSKPLKRHYMLATLKGMSLKYEGRDDLQGAEKNISSFNDTYYPGSVSRIFMIPYIKALAHYPKARLVHEGDQVIEGHKCEIFSFIMGKDFEIASVKNAAGLIRFYLDMQRGGHALKSEILAGGEIVSQVVDIKLEEFTTQDGAKLWLPVSGKSEGIFPKNAKSNENYKPGAVVNQETYSVMRGSVKINKSPDDKAFTLKLKDGTVITDKMNYKRSRAGANVKSEPVNLEQAESQLKALIKEGEIKGQEVTAKSVARGGGKSWTSWLPIILTSIATLSLIISSVAYLKRAKS